MNRERLQGFRQMHLKGSRLRDVAFFFASLAAVVASVLLGPLAIALCALSLLLTGCASPGTPRPPSLHLPRPVRNLQAMREGNRVLLQWTTPTDTTTPSHGPEGIFTFQRQGS